MAAIVDLSDLININTGGGSGTPEYLPFFKTGTMAGNTAPTNGVGRFTSYWRGDGFPGDAGSNPSTAANPTNATAGAIPQTDAGGARTKWLLSACVCASQPGSVVLYDRLAHVGGLSGTATGTQTGSAISSITRYTSGVGVEIWAEIYSAIGSTATTITCSYSNTTPTSGRTTSSTAFGGSNLSETYRMVPLPLQSGDVGVTAIASHTIAASTLTAGNFGITLMKRLVTIPVPNVGVANIINLVKSGIGPIEIKPGACLALMWVGNTTNTAAILPGSYLYFSEK